MAHRFAPRKQHNPLEKKKEQFSNNREVQQEARLAAWKLAIKRVLDIAAASLLLALLSPLLLLVALLIRLTSPGPALFRQKRLGKQGKVFAICKFRTMRVNAPDIRNADGSAFSSDNDPRVTPIGRWLRKTSVDELPQLLNVLRGSMSLVGPRPDQADQVAYYTEPEKLRLAVKPGMTGLAQISGRNLLSWDARKQLDVAYVRRWSLRSDFVILALTIPYVLCGRGVNADQSGE